jgi:MoxR-like ATPase
VQGARALAFLRGRAYTTPEDLIDIVPDVLRHRIMLSYEAISDNISTDAVIQDILKAVPAPTKPLQSHVQIPQTTAN